MPVNRDNIAEVVLNAWSHAHRAPIELDDSKTPNRQRSSKWVDALARQFSEHYPRERRYRVFWSRNRENRDEFRLNELLFDLAVCSVSETSSLQARAKPLPFIARCHWQIESEFNQKDTREIVIDMGKLVMGSGENKLFVAAHRGAREGDILEQSAPIAECCCGRVYFCFVTHPDDWSDTARPPVLFEWIAGRWSEIALPAAV